MRELVIRGAGGSAKGGSGAGNSPTEAKDTLISKAYARVIDLICEGPIKGFHTPDRPLADIILDGTPVENGDTRNGTDGAIASGTTTFTSSIAHFDKKTDTGRYLICPAKLPPLVSISKVTDDRTVELDTAALATGPTSGLAFTIGGSRNFKNFAYNYLSGTPNQPDLPNYNASETTTSVGIKLTNPGGHGGGVDWTVTITDTNVDAVLLSIQLPRLQKQISSGKNAGNIIGYHVAIKISYSLGGTNTFIPVPGLNGKPFDQNNAVPGCYEFDGKASSGYVHTFKIDTADFHGVGNGTFKIKVERLDADADTQNIQNETWVYAYTEVIYGKLSHPNSVLLASNFDSSQFSSVPKRGVHLHGLLIKIPQNYDPVARTYATSGAGTSNGTWDGVHFKTAYTNNPAWCFYAMATNRRWGLGNFVDESAIDKFTLYAISKYCDVQVPTGFGGSPGTEPRFTCNLYMQQANDAWKVLSDMMGICRGMVAYYSGVVVPVQDSPVPVTAYRMFSPANVINGQFSYAGVAMKARHNAVRVSWNDITDQGNLKYEYVEDTEAIAKTGSLNQLDIVGFGCSSRGQARRWALGALYMEKLLTDTVNFSTALEGFFISPGTVISVQDPFRAGAVLSGRLVAGSTPTLVNLDRYVTLRAGHTYYLQVIQPWDGKIRSKTITSGPGRYWQIHVQSLGFPPAPESVWQIGCTNLVNPELFRVLGVHAKDDNTCDVVGLQYNASIYDFIDFNDPLVVPPISQLPGAGAVQPPGKIRFTEEWIQKPNNDYDIRLDVNWAQSHDPYLSKYVVMYRHTGNWIMLPETINNSIIIEGMQEGWSVDVSVYAVNTINVRSQPSAATHVIGNVPPVPYGLPLPPKLLSPYQGATVGTAAPGDGEFGDDPINPVLAMLGAGAQGTMRDGKTVGDGHYSVHRTDFDDNCEFVARLLEHPDIGFPGRSGVQIRNTLDGSSRFVACSYRADTHVVEMWQRLSIGAAPVLIASFAQELPVWFELVRNGNQIVCAYSGDGTTWTILGNGTIGANPGYLGMFASSGDSGTLANSRWDFVPLTALPDAPPLPTVTGLEICGQGNNLLFNVNDPRFCWRGVDHFGAGMNQIVGTENLQGVNQSVSIESYLVAFYLGNDLLAVVTTTDQFYTWTLIANQAAMRAKYGPQAWQTPTFTCAVSARDSLGRYGPFSSIIVRNPPPTALSLNRLVLFSGSVSITFFYPGGQADLMGAAIYMSFVQNDPNPPMVAQVVYPNSSITIQLDGDPSTLRYWWAATWDNYWGHSALTYLGQTEGLHIAPVTFMPRGSRVIQHQQITLSCATPNVVIMYTFDTTQRWQVYNPSAKPQIDNVGTTTIYAYARITPWNSLTTSETYTTGLFPLMPSFDPFPGTYPENAGYFQLTLIAHQRTGDGTIYYTTDGSDPTSSPTRVLINGESGIVYLPVGTWTVKAIATSSETPNVSDIHTGIFVVVHSQGYNKCANPTFTPAGGQFPTYPQSILIHCENPAPTLVRLRYTLDGSIPTHTNGIDAPNDTTVVVHVRNTLRVIAIRNGWTDSDIVSVNYMISNRCVAPSFSPVAGNYPSFPLSVTISTPTPGASMRYTTDGTTPTSTHGTPVSGPVSVPVGTTLLAIAYKTGLTDSTPGRASYFQQPTCGAPTFTPPAGQYNAAQYPMSVELDSATTGAMIVFTVDGTTPTASVPPHGTVIPNHGAATVNIGQPLKALAFMTGNLNSAVTSGTYSALTQVAPPTFNPDGGSAPPPNLPPGDAPGPPKPPPTTTVSVTLDCPTAGATIIYTTDNTPPSHTNGIQVAAPTVIALAIGTHGTTLRAIAFKTGNSDSVEHSAFFESGIGQDSAA